MRLHHYAQTRPDADGWLAEQITHFASPEPVEWREWLLDAIAGWCDEWLPVLENLERRPPARRKARNTPGRRTALRRKRKAAELAAILRRLPKTSPAKPPRKFWSKSFRRRQLAAKRKDQRCASRWKICSTRRHFSISLVPVGNGNDPLAEDWNWVRGHMTALLRLTQNFPSVSPSANATTACWTFTIWNSSP